MSKIKNIKTLADIGCGYGRLVETYIYRAHKVYLIDPSQKLLSLAKKNHRKNLSKIAFINSGLTNLPQKTKIKFDVLLMVRVLHHINNMDFAFVQINRLLKKGGYLILDIPNKRHFKATFTEILKGNTIFPFDIFSKDLRSKRNIKKKTIPFINYHPETVIKKLSDNDFEIIEKRSVSNFRFPFFKTFLSLETLKFLESKTQPLLSRLLFGPSIFILAKKR